ncbi:MAG: class I SAM-dependent methyltransferase [Anaerolineae bacterium]|nr:class I SAM-dependent methyltransferase [Anaerolineae bacterium]
MASDDLAAMGNSAAFYETIARFYDAETAYMTDDLLFYTDLVAGEFPAVTAGVDGPVLDVGCGTGRVTLHMAQAGLPVVGVDIAEAMLTRAERKLDVLADLRQRIRLVQGDVLAVDLAERFALILVPYNGFMHFRTQADQLRLLARLREWLLPGGLILLDLPNPGHLYATVDDGALVLEREFFEPEQGHTVMQQSVSSLDRAAQIMDVTWIYDELLPDGLVRRTVAPLTLRYTFPAELDLLLRVAGLRRVKRYGDYDGSPFVDGCERLVVVAAAADSGA